MSTSHGMKSGTSREHSSTHVKHEKKKSVSRGAVQQSVSKKDLGFHNPGATRDILSSARTVSKLMTMIESKELKSPVYRGSEAPAQLYFKAPGYSLVDTSESILLRNTLASMLGSKEYRFRLSTAVNMSSSSGGAINSVITVSQIQFVADFISLSTVFQEFFINKMIVTWQPVSLYNYPLSGAIGTNVSSLPMGVASLQHNQSTYTSLSGMADNYALGFRNTGKEFVHRWINDEKRNSTVVAASTGVVQSWCESSNASNYQGQIQFISQSAPPGLPTSQVLGTFLVEFDVYMRVRT